MDPKKIKWLSRKPLTPSELEDIAEQIFSEDLPLDNNFMTDEEMSDSEDADFQSDLFIDYLPNLSSTGNSNSESCLAGADKLAECVAENQDAIGTDFDPVPPCSSKRSPQSAVLEEKTLDDMGKNVGTTKKRKETRSKRNFEEIMIEETSRQRGSETKAERRWKRTPAEEIIPDYHISEGPVESQFIGCNSPTDVFLRVMGDSVEDIVFQSNLYATQRNKVLNLTKEELFAFIGINFFMSYHRIPAWKNYWSTSEDLGVPLVAKCMNRNRFEEILRYLHCNDNTLIPKDNKDKIYKIRPLSDSLNRQFQKCYETTRRISIDESMILFKGRSSLKQYNPMKPIKRGYKLWCVADQNAYVSRFEVYQGKNEKLEEEFKDFGLGERIVLSLSKPYWEKYKIIYADNYFISINLLEQLYMKKTLACGTIRSTRLGFPMMGEDKQMKRGDYDYRVSNTKIRAFKWKDNKVVNFASNFHGTEEITVKRTQKDGTRVDVKCPSIVADYNKHMGGVDRADQLRSTYGMIRRSRKWWHRLFWGFLDIAFVNAYIIYNKMDFEKKTTLEFRRCVSMGLMAALNSTKSRRSGPARKRRKHNYSVPEDVRLGNRGSHWVIFQENRGRCEMCSAQAVQSRPYSKCSACGVFLCSNKNKNCFLEFHEMD